MNYPLPPRPVGPEDFSLEPHWDGSLLLTINGLEYRLPLNTARLLSQKLITESAKAKRLFLPEQ
jgi:hypothetical protein